MSKRKIDTVQMSLFQGAVLDDLAAQERTEEKKEVEEIKPAEERKASGFKFSFFGVDLNDKAKG